MIYKLKVEVKYIYLRQLAEKDFDSLYPVMNENSFLIHSILNTIEIEELIEVYLEEKNLVLRKKIESNLFRQFKSIKNNEGIYDLLYSKLKDCNYPKRQKVRKLLSELIVNLNTKFYNDFFDTFFFSLYRNDRVAALNISEKIWRDEFNNLFFDEYLNSYDEQFLRKILEFGNFKIYLEQIKFLWEKELTNSLKNSIIKLFGKEYFEKFEFLKELEPDKYLLLLTVSERTIKNSEFISIYQLLPNESKVYGILLLSSMKNWNLIKKEIENTFVNSTHLKGRVLGFKDSYEFEKHKFFKSFLR
ncbi:MAG: hypothetical protein IPM69_14820 [Ignavibacteria bacterium]|nr:hypothetical protein [Ignavibacteria bacterium]